jgi:hypothetical protein
MSLEIVEMIYTLVMLLVVGTFVVTFPITRRLGRLTEEWIAARRESVPERQSLARIESTVENIGRRLEALEQRTEFVGERQEFVESLLEQQRRTPLLPGEQD